MARKHFIKILLIVLQLSIILSNAPIHAESADALTENRSPIDATNQASPQTQVATLITGPLSRSSVNPRYFADPSGNIVFLSGSHFWDNLQDSGNTTQLPYLFNYSGWLDFLQARNHNFFRLWTWEQSKWVVESSTPYYWTPLPYQRTGPGNALDGQLKFDLTRFNQAYFDRMRSRIIAARDRGIYVSIMLFDGWSIAFPKASNSAANPWRGHPYNSSNNINALNGDPNNNNSGDEIEQLSIPAVTSYQEAYIRKVIDTVNDLDNVLYEIANESNGCGNEVNWQYHMISYIKSYEASKAKQHPVGMTVPYPCGDNATLFNSSADWISPNGDLNNPPVATGSKVIVADTDHLCGICGDRAWAWKSFTRGQNLLFMDQYDDSYKLEGGGYNLNTDENLRFNLGYIRTYANRINLAAMTPQSNLCSTGYCLAYAAATDAEYLVYLPNGGSVNVNVSAVSGSLTVEWFNPGTGTTTNGAPINGGATRTLSAPFAGDAILYLKYFVPPPVNDNFADAGTKTIGSIPYSDSLNTRGATEEANDPQVNVSCDGTLLNKGKKTVWYKYTPGTNTSVAFETVGSNYDTYIAVWTGTSLTNLSLVGCDNNNEDGLQSQFALDAIAGTTYYIEIAGYAGVQGTSPQSNPGGTLVLNANLTNVDVTIGGLLAGRSYVPASNGVHRIYLDVDNGPVQVVNTDGVVIVASTGINLKKLPDYMSYTELMGMPASKLTDTYIFPWYNNATAGGLSSQLRFGNVGNAETDVTVKIGGVSHGPYHLGLSESQRLTFDNIDAGPVEVKSSGGVPIIASMRINLKRLPTYSSYSEFMGVSASATVGTKYMFPWYGNASAGVMESQLRFGNVGNASTTVTISIGGVTQAQSFLLAPNESARVTFNNVDHGPAEVSSSGGVPIIASMRVNLKTNATYSSYSEFMGLPGVTVTETHYFFPWYNNATAGGLQSQLRFGNVGNAETDVTVKIGNVTYGPYHLGLNGSQRLTLDNVDAGPVEVFSSGGVPIIASMRINLKTNGIYSSYSEFMGLSVGAPLGMPGNELSTTYWFPWYNNANAGGLASQLRFSIP